MFLSSASQVLPLSPVHHVTPGTKASVHWSPSYSIDLAPHYTVLHTAVCVVISFEIWQRRGSWTTNLRSGRRGKGSGGGAGAKSRRPFEHALMFGFEIEREVEQQ